jgi:hypothetical protein
VIAAAETMLPINIIQVNSGQADQGGLVLIVFDRPIELWDADPGNYSVKSTGGADYIIDQVAFDIGSPNMLILEVRGTDEQYAETLRYTGPGPMCESGGSTYGYAGLLPIATTIDA